MTINTQDYRLAPSGEGPLAHEWKDKPHRLIYDLCGEVERLKPEGAWTKDWPTLPGKFWVYGFPFGKLPDTKPPEPPRCGGPRRVSHFANHFAILPN